MKKEVQKLKDRKAARLAAIRGGESRNLSNVLDRLRDYTLDWLPVVTYLTC